MHVFRLARHKPACHPRMVGRSTLCLHPCPALTCLGPNSLTRDCFWQAARLQLLLTASPEALEAYLEERHVSDVLADFSSSQPPLAALLACLRPLLPRLYSISSSMLEGPQQVARSPG